MGRVLKDGTWKPKPSAHKEYERLSKPATPMPVLRRGTEVKVFMGAGWAKGTVESSTRDSCTVYCKQLRRKTTCRDARNLEVL